MERRKRIPVALSFFSYSFKLEPEPDLQTGFAALVARSPMISLHFSHIQKSVKNSVPGSILNRYRYLPYMDPDPGSMYKVQTSAKNINFAGAGAANKGSAPLH